MLESKPLPRAGRGRPPKFSEPVTAQHLIHLLQHAKCTFSEACRRARWTPHLVKQMAQAHPEIEFEVRLACARPPNRKRLSASWGRPEVVHEVAREIDRLDAGHERRTWPEVVASIEATADGRAPDSTTLAAAMAEPVPIRPARTAEEEFF